MSARLRVSLLWLLTALFLARILGQALVGIYAPPSLPPWREWYSGLLPYPWLLLSQLLLLMFMSVVNTDNARAAGRFHVTAVRVRSRLRLLATLYAGVMVARHVIRMILLPEERWLGGTIPIFFHFVLAAWVGALAAAPGNAASDRVLK